jgi:uncharacterized protein (DUF697 family)
MLDTDPRHDDCERMIRRHTTTALAVGLLPLPWLDLAALAALQLNLIRALAKRYDVEFSREAGRSAIAALVGGGFPVSLATHLSSWVKATPVGWVVGGASLALMAAASTYAVGKVFVQHFESGNTMLTFDPAQVQGYYEQQLAEGKDKVRKSYAGIKP